MPFSARNKVAYVVKRYPRYSETFIVNEILAHERAGAEVVIFALRPPCDTHFQDCISKVRAPVYYVPGASPRTNTFWEQFGRLRGSGVLDVVDHHTLLTEPADVISQALWVADSMEALGVDHIHAHFATSAASVARIAAKLAGRTYSMTAHAKDIFHDDVDVDNLVRKIVDSTCAVTVSDYNVIFLRKLLLDRGREDACGKVERIYNGMDLGRFHFTAPQVDANRMVAVGRLVEKKGFSALVRACRRLTDTSVDFSCEIIGAGEQESVLREQIQSYGLAERVRLLGPLPQAEVIERVATAGLLAAPCVVGDDGNRDGLPTVILEAMALGTPCISTDVTGIPEVVIHEQTGLIVRQNDDESLANGLRRLLNDSALRLRVAHQARALIERGFDSDVTSAQLRAAFAREPDTTPPCGNTAVRTRSARRASADSKEAVLP